MFFFQKSFHIYIHNRERRDMDLVPKRPLFEACDKMFLLFTDETCSHVIVVNKWLLRTGDCGGQVTFICRWLLYQVLLNSPVKLQLTKMGFCLPITLQYWVWIWYKYICNLMQKHITRKIRPIYLIMNNLQQNKKR